MRSPKQVLILALLALVHASWWFGGIALARAILPPDDGFHVEQAQVERDLRETREGLIRISAAREAVDGVRSASEQRAALRGILWVRCEACGGRGGLRVAGAWISCGDCDGLGKRWERREAINCEVDLAFKPMLSEAYYVTTARLVTKEADQLGNGQEAQAAKAQDAKPTVEQADGEVSSE